MIMTSVFIVPFSAQAEQYPILPIPGTISTQCLTNESKYVSGNEKGRINYTYNIPSAGTLRLNINATLTRYDSDGQFSMRFETSFSNTEFYSDFESGFKGYINDYIEYDILPGTYTLTFFLAETNLLLIAQFQQHSLLKHKVFMQITILLQM